MGPLTEPYTRSEAAAQRARCRSTGRRYPGDRRREGDVVTSTLGPYTVREILGTHPLRLTTTVRAWDPQQRRDVALRTLAPHITADRAFAAGVPEDALAYARAAQDHPDLPNAVYAAVLEALATASSRRPATAGAFADALGHAASQRG